MIWVLQNQEIVPAGRYGSLLKTMGKDHAYCMTGEGRSLPVLEKGDGLIVLGGTMGVHESERYGWLNHLKDFIADTASSGTPILGICLGAQLLCAALGGRVTPNSCGERGMHPLRLTPKGEADPLFSGVSSSFRALQWHNDSFDLPAGADLLAYSSACPVQAFRCRNAYALQFHPEADESVVEGWNGLLDPPGDYVREFAATRNGFQPAWDRILTNFLALCA